MRYIRPERKVLQEAATAVGNGTVFQLNGEFASLSVQVYGTFVGTVTFEASVNGTDYVAICGINKNSGVPATTATAAGVFKFEVAGIHLFRARVSAYTSGSISVYAIASDAHESAAVALSGSTLDLRGLAANKPAADSVAVGTTYWAVDTGVIEVSTGTAWVVV